MAKAGDLVEIRDEKRSFQGILMPNESEQSIFIKLGNGYNIGISKAGVKSIRVIMFPSLRTAYRRCFSIPAARSHHGWIMRQEAP